MTTRIHVNLAAIKANEADGGRRPVIEVITPAGLDRCHGVSILGPCRVVYAPDDPLASGAKVYIETESEIVVALSE